MGMNLNQEDFNESISFLKKVEPEASKAPAWLWIATVTAFVLHVSVSVGPALSAGSNGAKLIGTLLGASFWPVVITALSANWNKTQRGRVKVFGTSCLVLLLISAVTVLSINGYADILRAK